MINYFTCDTCDKQKTDSQMKQCPICKKWHCKSHYGPETECHTCVYSLLCDAIAGFRKDKGFIRR